MNMLEPITIDSVTTSVCRIELKEGNLIFIHLFENASIEIPEVEEMYKNLNTLVNNEPHYLVVVPSHGNTSSQEARKYAAELKEKNIIAEALIVNSLGIRILANFYIKVNRPKQKIRTFSNIASALTWINSQREESKTTTSKSICL
jgi:hypothetical protein